MVEPVSIASLVLAVGESGSRAKEAAESWLQGNETDRLLDHLEHEFGDSTGLTGPTLQKWRMDEAFLTALFAVSRTADWRGYRRDLFRAVVDLAAQDPHHPGYDDLELAESVVSAIEGFMPHAKRDDELSRHLADRADLEADRRHQEQMRALDNLPEVLATGMSTRSGATEFLIRGPHDRPDVRDLVKGAEIVAEDEPARSAELLMKAAERLETAGVEALAETYQVKAAEHLFEADQAVRARELLEGTARRQLAMASSLSQVTLTRYRRRAQASDRWRVDALDANLNWLGDPEGARDAAIEATRREEQEAEWRLGGIEVLVLLESWEDVRELTAGPLPSDEPSMQTRFRLARLEALIELEDERSEEMWLEVEESLVSRPAGERALALQRRGMRLALTDAPNAARDSYREAMRCWSEEPGADDEIASCFYSSLTTALLHGIRTPDTELMPLAAELHGSRSSTTVRAEGREALAMRQRLNGKLREAFFSYCEALRLFRLSGNLMGSMGVHERLGDLFREAERPQEAATFFASAGKADQALAAAHDLNRAQLEQVATPHGPIWERAAQYQLLSRYGGLVSEEFVAQHLETLRVDAQMPRAKWFGPDLRAAAQAALAGVLLQIPIDAVSGVAEGIEAEARTGMPKWRQMAGNSLVLATTVGRHDASDLLVDAYLNDPQHSGVEAGWVVDQARSSADVMSALESAAREGSLPALELIAMAEPSSTPQNIVDLAVDQIGATDDLKSVEHQERQVKIAFGVRRERLGILASLAPSKVREQLAMSLLEAALDEEEPESNRASAMNALFNLADKVPLEVAISVARSAKPLAAGNYEASPWDDQDDPLAAIRLSTHTPDELRGASLQALGRIGARPDIPDHVAEDVDRAIAEALEESSSELISDALEAAARCGPHSQVPLKRFLEHDDKGVRQAALELAIEHGRLTPGDIERAVSDPSPSVRQALFRIDEPQELRRLARESLAKDPHAYLRALATA